ncbi:hypothetical protein PTKIN_Ptkin16aG0481700 [Pterospermum kingtungense]
MNHPFHRNHNLSLLVSSPYPDGIIRCDFCYEICERFVYHCSCGLDFHIKCALLSYNTAEKRIAEFQHIPRIDPLISTENRPQKLENAQCFACWKPLLDSVHLSPDFVVSLARYAKSLSVWDLFTHVHHIVSIECVTMPTKVNKLFHRKHPLILQIVNELLPCQICQETQLNEAVYFCSKCKFVLHTGCASPPPIIEDKIHHEHPFTLLQKQVSLACDACGTLGNYIPYVCSTCNIMVHKKCISLPQIIQFFRHHHPIFQTYFLEEHGFESWECKHCYEEVNTEHGSYFCSKCNYIVHVNCALEQPHFYNVVDTIETDEAMEMSFQHVTATSIKHFSHYHNLIMSEDIVGDKQCDGCLLPISASYYCCSQCNFFLHKSCAELPKKKHIWYHYHRRLFRLTSGCISQCAICVYKTSGFAYNCDECEERHCLRCALVSDSTRCEGHEHLLRAYPNCKGLCNACGGSTEAAYGCKSCNFTLHNSCMRLPLIARHKYDEHPLQLAYQDNNRYSLSDYCDICEEERNPNHWFYHCAICKN